MRISLLVPTVVALGLLGQGPKFESADRRNTPAERLESMRAAMKSYDVTLESKPPVAIKVQDEPAFRVGRQAGNLFDGAVFLWVDELGRPEAAMEAFLITEADAPDGKWIHEFTSLSTHPITATRGGKSVWTPAEPGLKFEAVTDAPKPASTAAQRIRQMKAIADEIRIDDDFGGRGYTVLRMLTKPIARYGKAGSKVEDGALFGFVEGTDVETLLFVEARPGTDGLEYHYALAPMGCWAMKASRKSKVVWDLPWRPTGDAKKPLFNYQFRP